MKAWVHQPSAGAVEAVVGVVDAQVAGEVTTAAEVSAAVRSKRGHGKEKQDRGGAGGIGEGAGHEGA